MDAGLGLSELGPMRAVGLVRSGPCVGLIGLRLGPIGSDCGPIFFPERVASPIMPHVLYEWFQRCQSKPATPCLS